MILTVTPNPSLDRTLEVPAFAAGAASLAETVAGTVSVARYSRLFESARATEL